MPTVSLSLDLTGYVEPPPPGQGFLEIHAYFLGSEINADGTVDTLVFATPATLQLAAGAYTVRFTYMGMAQTLSATVTEGKTVRVDGKFLAFPSEAYPVLAAGGAVLVVGLIYSLTRKNRSEVKEAKQK